LLLRATATLNSDEIKHVPYVLYHWRAIEGSTALDSNEKDYAKSAGIRALQSYIEAAGENAVVQPSEIDTAYRVKYGLPADVPLVSIIIPTYNSKNILENCIASVLEKTEYPNYEIVIVDNRSDDRACLEYLAAIAKEPRISILHFDKPFNYSAINIVNRTK